MSDVSTVYEARNDIVQRLIKVGELTSWIAKNPEEWRRTLRFAREKIKNPQFFIQLGQAFSGELEKEQLTPARDDGPQARLL